MKFNGRNIHVDPSAQVGLGVKLGDNVTVYPNVVIKDGAIICNDVVLGEPTSEFYSNSSYSNPQTIIGANSLIRSHAIIYAGVELGDNFSCGHRVTVREFTVMENCCRIGSYSDVQQRVSLGSYSWIHSGVFVPNQTKIGCHVMIYPHVIFTDDRTPPSDDLSAPIIRDFAQVGAHSTILPGVIVGRHTLVGAGSVVTKSVADFMCVVGNPADVKMDVRDIKLEDGSAAYPWPRRFSRGMPWCQEGFDNWLKGTKTRLE